MRIFDPIKDQETSAFFQDYKPDITLVQDSLANTELILNSKLVGDLEEEKFRYERCNWIITNSRRKTSRER